MSGPSSIATNREDMEGASPVQRAVAKNTKVSGKFQAVILSRLEANWRALVRRPITQVDEEYFSLRDQMELRHARGDGGGSGRPGSKPGCGRSEGMARHQSEWAMRRRRIADRRAGRSRSPWPIRWRRLRPMHEAVRHLDSAARSASDRASAQGGPAMAIAATEASGPPGNPLVASPACRAQGSHRAQVCPACFPPKTPRAGTKPGPKRQSD